MTRVCSYALFSGLGKQEPNCKISLGRFFRCWNGHRSPERCCHFSSCKNGAHTHRIKFSICPKCAQCPRIFGSRWQPQGCTPMRTVRPMMHSRASSQYTNPSPATKLSDHVFHAFHTSAIRSSMYSLLRCAPYACSPLFLANPADILQPCPTSAVIQDSSLKLLH